MAVAVEGFCIRELAAKMRSVDIAKSWPFCKDLKKEEMEALLPPISFKKFGYWRDELGILISKEANAADLTNSVNTEEGLELTKGILEVDGERTVKICPVCRVFTSATMNGVNAHIDSCLNYATGEGSRLMRSAATNIKSRTPKKRSIVEIFSVAPAIKIVNNNDNDDDGCNSDPQRDQESQMDIHVSKSSVTRGRKNKHERGPSMSKKKKKRKVPIGTEKDKMHKLPTSVPDNSNLYHASQKKGPEKESSTSVVDKRKKGSSLNGKKEKKCLNLSKKKHTPHKKDEKDNSGIYPKRKKSPIVKSLQRKHKLIKLASENQEVEKQHVIPAKCNTKNQMEIPRSHTKIVVDNAAKDRGSNCEGFKKTDRQVRFSDKDDILGNKKKIPSPVELPSTKSCNKGINSDLGPVPSLPNGTNEKNKCSSGMGQSKGVNGIDQDVFLDITGKVDSYFLHKNDRVNDDLENASLKENASRNESLHSNEVLITLGSKELSPGQTTMPQNFAKHGFTQKMLMAKESNEGKILTDVFKNSIPSIECLRRNTDDFPFQHQIPRRRHLSPKELMSSICSSVDQETIDRINFMNEDLIGLPLNSQGEYIQLHPSANIGFSQHFKRQNSVPASVSKIPMCNLVAPWDTWRYTSMDKPLNDSLSRVNELKWSDEQNYFTKNSPFMPSSSSSGFVETEDTERREFQIYSSEKRKKGVVPSLDSVMNDVSLSYHGCKDSDPSFTVTNTGEDADQGTKVSQHSTQTTMRLMGKNLTVNRSSNEYHGSEDRKICTNKEIITEICHTSPYNNSNSNRCFQREQDKFLVNSAMPNQYDIRSVECRTGMSLDSQKPFYTTKEYLTPGNTFTDAILPKQSLLKIIPSPQENCFTGNQPVSINQQAYFPASSVHRTCPLMECNYHHIRNHNPVGLSQPIVQFPFLDQNDANCFRQTPGPFSSTLPHWLIKDAKQKEEFFANLEAHEKVCSMSGTRYLPLSSTFPSPIFPFPTENVANSLSPIGHGNKSHEITRAIDDSAYANKTKAQSASKFCESTNHMKKLRMGIYGNSDNFTEKNQKRKSNTCIRCDLDASGIYACRDKAAMAVDSYGIDEDSVNRSGPIKLRAGAKHILKPSQNMDPDNSKPIHSTVPFGVRNGSNRMRDCQRKSSKIYSL